MLHSRRTLSRPNPPLLLIPPVIPAPLPLPRVVPPPSIVASPASSVSFLVFQMDIPPIAYR
ncbi:hypothetical protein FA13DRAFT_1735730 [Coprinellus micaceus]|uniref:Uncharacterized protein n=1 Tax=Coprinellus micaceus TaxID=71717 RepID=A0A4Y7T2K5_COPMI|nr:hypothetical protein FA13DRAFT_1735730 [Coprinellus micaceus]